MINKNLVRTLKKSWQYYCTVIFSLSLTLAALFSVLSVVDIVYWQPLPYGHPDKLYWLQGQLKYNGADVAGTNLANLDYVKKNNQTLSGVASYFTWSDYKLVQGSDKTPVPVYMADSNFFDVLDVKPLLGRFFDEREATGNKQPSAVMGYQTWQNQFAGDPNIVGKTIQLNSRRFKVIGVAPQGWAFPNRRNIDKALWLPLDMDEQFAIENPQIYAGAVFAIARFKPTATLAQAQTEMNALMSEAAGVNAPRIAKAYPVSAIFTSFNKQLTKDSAQVVSFLLIGMLLLVFIALVNLCSLQLSRAVLRQQTLAISYAFGASKKQLYQQVFKHNLILVGTAALLGTLLTILSFGMVRTLGHEALPRLDSLHISWLMLAIIVLISVVIAGLFTWVELKGISEEQLANTLQNSGKGTSKQLSRTTSNGLIGLQVALSVITLLISSQVLFNNLSEINRPTHVQAQNLWSAVVNYSDIEDKQTRINLAHTLRDKLKALPNVDQVAESMAEIVPDALNMGPVMSEGMNIVANAKFNVVDENFFAMAGLDVDGRSFQETDKALEYKPVIINRRLADKLGGNPIGQKIMLGDNKKARPITGVVNNINYPGRRSDETPVTYLAGDYDGWPENSFLLRVNDASSTLTTAQLDKLVTQLDPRIRLISINKVGDQFHQLSQKLRFSAWLAGAVALITLLMVLAGVYGIITYMLFNRRYEIGVRMAFGGANRVLLSEEFLSVAKPIAISLIVALSLIYLLANLLLMMPQISLGISWLQIWIVVLAVCVVLALVTVHPIWKTLRHDPIKALRNE